MIVAAILVAAGSGDASGTACRRRWSKSTAGRCWNWPWTVPGHPRRSGPRRRRAGVVDVAHPAASRRAAVVAGGRTRQESVSAGLAALSADVDLVLVHDVARPFMPAAVIDRVLDGLLLGADAVIPVRPVTDTDQAGRR